MIRWIWTVLCIHIHVNGIWLTERAEEYLTIPTESETTALLPRSALHGVGSWKMAVPCPITVRNASALCGTGVHILYMQISSGNYLLTWWVQPLSSKISTTSVAINLTVFNDWRDHGALVVPTPLSVQKHKCEIYIINLKYHEHGRGS